MFKSFLARTLKRHVKIEWGISVISQKPYVNIYLFGISMGKAELVTTAKGSFRWEIKNTPYKIPNDPDSPYNLLSGKLDMTNVLQKDSQPFIV